MFEKAKGATSIQQEDPTIMYNDVYQRYYTYLTTNPYLNIYKLMSQYLLILRFNRHKTRTLSLPLYQELNHDSTSCGHTNRRELPKY